MLVSGSSRSFVHSQNPDDLETHRCYRHFKGQVYYLLGVGRHTEFPDQHLVVYHPVDQPFTLFLRPFQSFISLVPASKHSENTTGQVYRFEPYAIV